MEYMTQFAFGVFPYLAGTIFLLGCLLRYDRGQYTWRAMSSQILHKTPAFRWGSNLFHVGILLLFFGHLFGLLVPKEIYTLFITTEQKQWIAIVAGGIFGTMCLVGISILLWRRLFIPAVRANSAPADTFIIVLLFLQLLTGLYTIFHSIDHGAGTMVALANWAQHIVTFQHDAWMFVTEVHWAYKLHIGLGMLMFASFPFTRLIHIWSWPFTYLWRNYQVVRVK